MKQGMLRPFRGRKSEAEESIAYSLWREGNLFGVEFELKGLLEYLAIPSQEGGGKPERCDGLWQHTCFELFLHESSGNTEEYYECNFSPTGDWNVYSLSSYRTDIEQVALQREPKVEMKRSGTRLSLSARIDFSGVLEGSEEIIAGISCVVEDKGGEFSYWALSHPRDKLDFHDPRSFLKIL